MEVDTPPPKKPRLRAPSAAPTSPAEPASTWSTTTRRPLPHDVMIHICDYLGNDFEYGDHLAGSTLANIMCLSSEGYTAAGRNLYRTVVVRRDTFSKVFGGNDSAVKETSPTSSTVKLLSQTPITFPTRASMVRKLGLFQFTRRLVVSDLPSEQAVDDLNDALRVAWSKPTQGVACQDALSGVLFPRVEKVAFSGTVFLNQQSLPPLGPENERGIHRFLTFLCREASPHHMCLSYPTPVEIGRYRRAHGDAEKFEPPQGEDEDATPRGSFDHAAKAPWTDYLGSLWALETITVHNVRCRSSSTYLSRLKCKALRIFASELKDPCRCKARMGCSHDDLLWARFGNLMSAFARASREPKPACSIADVEIANTGAGFPLTCECMVEYSNIHAWLRQYLRKRAEGAKFTLHLPVHSKSAPCVCCHVGAKPLGDDEQGNPDGTCTARFHCRAISHRWERGLRPVTEFTFLTAPAPPNMGNGAIHSLAHIQQYLPPHFQLHHLSQEGIALFLEPPPPHVVEAQHEYLQGQGVVVAHPSPYHTYYTGLATQLVHHAAINHHLPPFQQHVTTPGNAGNETGESDIGDDSDDGVEDVGTLAWPIMPLGQGQITTLDDDDEPVLEASTAGETVPQPEDSSTANTSAYATPGIESWSSEQALGSPISEQPSGSST